MPILHIHWKKKKRLNDDLANIRIECQRLLRRIRRHHNRKHELTTALLLLIENSLRTNRRSVWCLKKIDKWWFNIVLSMSDDQFKNNFRVNRSTFSILLNQVAPLLNKNDTNFRKSIPVEKRVCCALYCLGSTAELRTVAHLFGLGKSTVGEICLITVDLFFHRLVTFPTIDDEIKKTIDGFLTNYQYPLCLGALDGTHISITPPMGFETDYFNYKKFHSIIMLAVVDANLRFTYVNVGAPGRCNDASV